jgi:hypothetical protein
MIAGGVFNKFRVVKERIISVAAINSERQANILFCPKALSAGSLRIQQSARMPKANA